MFGKFPALVVAVSIPIASIYPAQAQDSKAPPISEYRENQPSRHGKPRHGLEPQRNFERSWCGDFT